MFDRELSAVGLGDHAAFRDADQRIVRFVIVFARKERLVGRNQRQALGVSEIEQSALAPPLLRHAVALQFDVEAIAEQRHQLFATRRRELILSRHQRKIENPAQAAGERDDPLRFAGKPVDFQMRLLVRRRIEERARIQSHQTAIALLACRKKNEARQFADMPGIARITLLVAKIDCERAADNRLNARTRHLLGKFQRTEHIVGVGERERGLAIRFRKLGETRDRQRAFEQRIRRMHMQMNEARAFRHVVSS